MGSRSMHYRGPGEGLEPQPDPEPARCAFGDPYCPCQDGDPCHYVEIPGSPGMAPPITEAQ